MGQRFDLLLIDEAIKEKKLTIRNFFEIGSRDGIDSEYICNKYLIDPRNCFIFEPHPELFKNIKNSLLNFNIFNIAIYNKTEPIQFNAIKDEKNNIGMSSILSRNIDKSIFDVVTVDA